MPLMIPLAAAAALFSFILLPREGLLDYYLAKLGVPAINWRGDTDLALGSIVAITVWKNTGCCMLFFLVGLTGVPRDLLDAATIDGAGAWRRFRSPISAAPDGKPRVLIATDSAPTKLAYPLPRWPGERVGVRGADEPVAAQPTSSACFAGPCPLPP